MTNKQLNYMLPLCILFMTCCMIYLYYLYYYNQNKEQMNTNNEIVIPKNVKIIYGNPPNNYFYSEEQIDSILTKMDNNDGKIYIVCYIGMGYFWYVKRDSIKDKISMFYVHPYDTSNELENFIKGYKYIET